VLSSLLFSLARGAGRVCVDEELALSIATLKVALEEMHPLRSSAAPDAPRWRKRVAPFCDRAQNV
jgi:hypothetical protein